MSEQLCWWLRGRRGRKANKSWSPWQLTFTSAFTLETEEPSPTPRLQLHSGLEGSEAPSVGCSVASELLKSLVHANRLGILPKSRG